MPNTVTTSRRLIPVLLALVVLVAGCGTEVQPVDMVLIVDTSASMRGAGGTADIFDQVLETAQEIIGEVAPGSNVSVIAYDSDIRPYPRVEVTDDQARARVNQLIAGLEANGKYTYTTKAIQDGLAVAEANENRGTGNRQVVVLLTDGLNDPPPSARSSPLKFDDVVAPYAGKPWYVFYVQLGNDLDADLQQVLGRSFENTETISDPAGLALDELTPKIAKDWKRPVLKVTRWVGLVIGGVILLILLGVLFLRLRSYTKGKRLYGVLEHWQTDSPGGKGSAELSGYGTSTGVGSGGIAIAGCTQELFKLSTTREDGQWVVIARTPTDGAASTGMIRFKGRTQPLLTLYNGDVFEAGRWSFRYRGETGPRPR